MLTAAGRRSTNLQVPDDVMLKPLQLRTIAYAHMKEINQLLLFV